ncbi:chromate efflux transporter [Alkalimonas collagenimarina]|uniref:Chromate efflux transporter n=1 Tax=Alkalimonas collagenimarina TaxID=400390 RepID=A0ABT9GZY7_9GAMM|nr:chromate efflux transporter [Alkalimonas collagenimarina]MDP4536629.1 chromate efflux transporter [Alkalimonas collagenimarina]
MPDISFREALAVWWRIGLLSFGGPAGQIALMHRILVEEKGWVDESRFLHALNYCMLLPGPEAQQLATYIGWLLHGVKGGLVAGILFIIPGALLILVLSLFYVLLGDVPLVEGLFFGLKAAVLAIVLQALFRISQKALKNRLAWGLAIAGFIALFAFNLPFPLVVLGAGLIGYLLARINTTPSDAKPVTADVLVRPGTKTAAVACTLLWFATLLALLFLVGGDQVFSQIALFFSKMAVVTFGGAYAVLGYVAQQGVEHYGWLQPGEMLDGLGLAETTPGPLILVTQFVGFLAAFREYGIWGGILGALLTTWVTFLPCFVWIFAGAPYVEKLRSNQALSAALAAITAAVVGVIANLALWFGLNVLFAERFVLKQLGLELLLPDLSSVNLAMLALTLLACLLLFVFKRGLFVVLGSCALLGIGWQLLV